MKLLDRVILNFLYSYTIRTFLEQMHQRISNHKYNDQITKYLKSVSYQDK